MVELVGRDIGKKVVQQTSVHGRSDAVHRRALATLAAAEVYYLFFTVVIVVAVSLGATTIFITPHLVPSPHIPPATWEMVIQLK